MQGKSFCLKIKLTLYGWPLRRLSVTSQDYSWCNTEPKPILVFFQKASIYRSETPKNSQRQTECLPCRRSPVQIRSGPPHTILKMSSINYETVSKLLVRTDDLVLPFSGEKENEISCLKCSKDWRKYTRSSDAPKFNFQLLCKVLSMLGERLQHRKSYVPVLLLVVVLLTIVEATLLFPRTHVLNVSAVETTNSVGVYWNTSCEDRVYSLDWGNLYPGAPKTLIYTCEMKETKPWSWI